MLTMASNDSGFSTFQQALNTSRTQTALTAPTNAADVRMSLSNGQVSANLGYNDAFRANEPYIITMVSPTQFSITDQAGNDYTSEATNAGKITPDSTGGVAITLRGVDMKLNINLKEGETNAVLTGHSFTLVSKPDTLTGARSPANGTQSQVTGLSVTDATKYAKAFPDGNAVLKFGTGGTYELYAQPLTANSRPVASGTLAAGATSVTTAGVTFNFDTPPGDNDQYTVTVNKHQTQNILDTVSQLRQALEKPIDGSTAAQQQLRSDLDSAIANISSGQNQLAYTVTSIGARGKALDLQEQANESLSIANASTQSSIRDSDPAEVMTRLTLQQTMLQASQMAFSRISQLSLFNSL